MCVDSDFKSVTVDGEIALQAVDTAVGNVSEFVSGADYGVMAT